MGDDAADEFCLMILWRRAMTPGLARPWRSDGDRERVDVEEADERRKQLEMDVTVTTSV